MTSSSAPLYYKPSGRFALSSLITVLPFAIAVQIVLAIMYGYGDLYVPFVKFRAVLTLLFGTLVGAVSLITLRVAKVRNNRVVLAWSVGLALIAWYASWVAWAFAFLRRAMDEPISINIAALSQPTAMWRLASAMNEAGVWSIGRSGPTTGAMLWTVWGFEALIILGIAILFPLANFAKQPFCEACDRWCTKMANAARLKMTDLPELTRQLESKNFRHLEGLGVPEPDALQYLRLDLYGCPTCPNTNTLSIKAVTVNVDKKGVRTESTKDVVNLLLLSAAEMTEIRVPARFSTTVPPAPPQT